ncbi:uncharacterized protein GLRG_11691 [Colletotrichum graminicola M1.001]|uniref:Uncharacterized protein n=1 Tax=Colletotrichum graminicola (strain M1.001 / M2 / FGSC 10212) TaxID=645133 RepID=E3R094_COLGM|nr:uncharacterized protein GLRG_11691 [Colletotrichum graminicola M1.001]EFQ36532.1 hypothetical protein GLRG_11691 [Colletotrichum graminicola M1.001]
MMPGTAPNINMFMMPSRAPGMNMFMVYGTAPGMNMFMIRGTGLCGRGSGGGDGGERRYKSNMQLQNEPGPDACTMRAAAMQTDCTQLGTGHGRSLSAGSLSLLTRETSY